MKTIQIVGGGLAGLALGISLRRAGVPVRVHEAGRYPRHRVCGEFINGVTQKTLERLGVAEVFVDVRRHRTTQWYLQDHPMYSTELEQPALGVSRFWLDEKLAGLLRELGGELETGCRLARTAQEGWVWAAGRTLDRESRWLGLKVHVAALEKTADLEMHLGSDGYVGLTPVEDGKTNVCGLFRRQEVNGRGVNLLVHYLHKNGLGVLAERLEAAQVDERSLTGVSAFRLGPQRVEEGVCVVGDAESMIPPFTGNGMSMALEAAEAASEPLRWYAQDKYDWQEALEDVRGRLQQRFRKRLFTARVLHPLLFSEFGRMMLSASARSGLLPFGSLSRLLR